VIVISGALVLVALVLLVIGLIVPSLGFVYASIGASVAAFAFLVVGILQRRKSQPVPVQGAPGSAEEIAAVLRTPDTHPVAAEEIAVVAAASSPAGATGSVLVVEGRPRYHVAGCRYLTGRIPAELEVSDARTQGFTPCGVCKPDEALAAAPVAEPAVEEEVSAVTVTKPAATAPVKKAAAASKAPAKKAAAAAKAAAPAKAVKAVKAPAKKAAATAAKVPAKAAAKTVAAPAKKAAAKAAPAKKAPAKKAAAK
jgi:hypothetical protein